MNEDLEIIKQLKALRTDKTMPQSERETIFLNNLKYKLEIYISQNPVKMGKFENFYYNIKGSGPFINLKKFSLFNNTYANSAVLALIILAIGIGSIASASQTSLPGDNFYPIKILSEELRSALTVSPASKAQLETEFSAKRIEEIKKIIQKNGTESKKINIALDHLQKNTAKAADIIDKEKQSGNDVSALAKDIEEKNNANQNALKQILENSEKKVSEPSDKNESQKDKNDTEKSTNKKREDDAKKDSVKKETTKPIPNLPSDKSETKKDTGAAIANPEIKIKNRIEERDSDSNSENEEDND